VVIQGCGLAAALTTMHHNSIVHLDLHPGNVLQDWGSNWVLADCGNAVYTKSQDQANWQHESRHVTSALVNHDVRSRVYIWHDFIQLQACVGSQCMFCKLALQSDARIMDVHSTDQFCSFCSLCIC